MYSNAQSFKGKQHHSLQMGFNWLRNTSQEHFRLGSIHFPLGVAVEYEFGIHKYLGIGIQSFIGFSYSSYAPDGKQWGQTISYNWHFSGSVSFNFHVHQLLDDKLKRDLKADQWDAYIGLNGGLGGSIGNGIGGPPEGDKVGTWTYGGHFGVRWTSKIGLGVVGEFGYGKSIVFVGLVYRFDKEVRGNSR